MNMLIKLMKFYIPGFIKKRKLKELFLLTADAFGVEPPDLRALSFDECLTKYALFTKAQAESVINSGRSIEEVKQRLYQNAFLFGKELRISLGIKINKNIIEVLRIIYRLIGIDFHYNNAGEVIIKRCFFSIFYSSGVCRLISSLDEGLTAGLSEGGSLSFKQRITEGLSCCSADLHLGD